MGRQFSTTTGSLAVGIDAERFEVRREHLKLLSAAAVIWFDHNFGAPGIDPTRPYGRAGSYSIMADIGRILGIAPQGIDDEFDGPDFTEDQERYFTRLHCDLEIVLAIMCQGGVIEPGTYSLSKDVVAGFGRRVWLREKEGAGFSVQIRAQMLEQQEKLLSQHIDAQRRRAEPHCPKCCYTAADARKHMDHHLCDGVIPGYEEGE